MMNKRFLLSCAALLAVTVSGPFHSAQAAFDSLAPTQGQVVVYGGTPAGVMAAVAAARRGNTVVLVDINNHLGGMVSGGLTETDVGDAASIGGLSREFFNRIVKYYSDKYGAGSAEEKRCHGGFHFEPHVAEKVFDDLVAEQAPRITVWHGYRFRSAVVQNKKIISFTADHPADGKSRTFTGDIFIDASYEGDLMAGAKVPYRIGREARSEYNEYVAGVTIPAGEQGQADRRTMAFNFRMSLCNDPKNRVLFTKPADYDPTAGPADKGRTAMHVATFGELFASLDNEMEPNGKFDANWCDLAGITDGYPDGDWATRDAIAAKQKTHSMSIMYYVQNDPAVPAAFRADAQHWGYSKDEFTDNGNFPFQFYVREARRMVGACVMTEKDISQDRYKPDGICAGSYGVDCHVMRLVKVDGKEKPDATRHFLDPDFDIPYAALTPKADSITNLLVPVCLSSSHVAFDAIRLEPVYMMLGNAAGEAAHLAIAGNTTVQKVDVTQLRNLLAKDGAILNAAYQPPVKVTWSPKNPMPGQKVHFTVVEDGVLKDPLSKVWWDFDGTGKVSATGREADFSFPLEKTYNVHLLVEDSTGHRRMITSLVPVGAAPVRDVMVHAFDASTTGLWDAGYPFVAGHPRRFADVFFGPAVFVTKVVHDRSMPAKSVFQTKLPAPGRYQISLGFRPAAGQASNTPVTITHDGQTTTLSVDQKTETTPFPLVPLGEFHFSGTGGDSVTIKNIGANGLVTFDSVHWVWLGN